MPKIFIKPLFYVCALIAFSISSTPWAAAEKKESQKSENSKKVKSKTTEKSSKVTPKKTNSKVVKSKKSTKIVKGATSKKTVKTVKKSSKKSKSNQVQGVRSTPLPVPTQQLLGKPEDLSAFKKFQKDTALGTQLRALMSRYHPDKAGLIMTVDATSNEVLAWSQWSDGSLSSKPTYIPQNTFPPASLAKIITAAAAFESKQYNANSTVPLIGHPYKLYVNQIHPNPNADAHMLSIDSAFGLSINPVFGILGLRLGGKTLAQMGRYFGFDTDFPLNLPQKSVFSPPDSGYVLAEKACGFTRTTLASPLHIAAMVRSIVMEKPFMMTTSQVLYPQFAPRASSELNKNTLSPSTYENLKQSFRATISSGTARKSLRQQVDESYENQLDIGGKTGSLDGTNPTGRYDWFVGYAQEKNNKNNAVIVLVMQVHGKYRNQKSTWMAGQVINAWSRRHLNK